MTIIIVSLCKKDAKTYFLLFSHFFLFLLFFPPSIALLEVYGCSVCILLTVIFQLSSYFISDVPVSPYVYLEDEFIRST